MREESLESDNLLLLQGLRNGNSAAFTSVYNLYSKPLYRKLLFMVKDEEMAKELLQDLFMKIWINREHIDLSRSFKSYMYVIAANMVYDHFRDVAKSRKLTAQLLQASVDYYYHSEEAVICKDNLTLIKNAIEKLSPQRKKVFIMCKLDGKSYEEVSKELAISTSTIRDHIVKANRIVKEYLHSHPDLAICLFLTSVII